jgi:hypothetical protein
MFDVNKTFVASWVATNDTPRLGMWYNGTHDYNGHIGTAYVYNRALSGQEVLENYNATKSRYGF